MQSLHFLKLYKPFIKNIKNNLSSYKTSYFEFTLSIIIILEKNCLCMQIITIIIVHSLKELSQI